MTIRLYSRSGAEARQALNQGLPIARAQLRPKDAPHRAARFRFGGRAKRRYTPAAVIGQRFGNYRATALLGEGGMGAVYLAEHPGIGRQVAIKVLRPEFGQDEQLLGRFINEARAANSIRHPNIIEILDSGVTENGISYLVMELLRGESLATRLQRLGKIEPVDAAVLGMQTASALGAAHAKGIVHRDLKPDNLFIVPDEATAGQEHIKVLDFGIAKLQAARAVDSVKTRTGTLMGTPAYMSPEQCLGTKEIDHHSDIYSLGIIVYEMLTGQPPFVSEGFGALVNMHLNEAPRSPRESTTGIPVGLEQAVLKMLAKRPEDRFHSMSEVQGAFAAAVGLVSAPYALSQSAAEIHQGLSTTVAAASGSPVSHAPSSPALTPPARPTTLSSHTGEQMASMVSAPPVARSRGLLVAVAAAAVAIGGITAVLLLRKPEPTSTAITPPTPPAPPTTVASPPVQAPPLAPQRARARIETVPPGARIVRVSDSAVLGTTPQVMELPRSSDPLAIRLELEGHVSETRNIPLDADSATSIDLQPIKHAEPQAGSGKKHPATAHPSTPSGEEPAKL